MQIAKNKALQYEEPGRLAAMMYLQSVIQMGIDVMWLGTEFSGQEVAGVGIVIGANAVKLGCIIFQKR